MGRWGKLLLVSLLLAIALTAAFRFIQHTDHEYAFWVSTFGETAARLEARCAALQSPDVCARAKERRSLADELRAHRDAVMAWWWPVLLAMLLAWSAAAVSAAAMVRKSRCREILDDPSHGKPGN
jgi:cobalamin synthase